MPKPIKKKILKALEEYQQRVADILTKQGVKAHVVGDLNAYKKLAPITIDFGSVQRGAKEFGKEYGALLKKEGATMIKGKKVAWLAESMKDTRGKVADIINEGIRTGKGTDAIARELRGTLVRDKNYEYKRIARTETGNIEAHAADKRYNEEGVEEVDWLCGQNPCSKCAPYCGKRYKINEAPRLLVHPNCTCDKAPVVTRRVRGKIDKKSVEIKKKVVTQVKPKVAPKKAHIEKPKVVKKKPDVTKKEPTKKEVTTQMKKEEQATANELWKKTAKDGKEHAKTYNSGIKIWDGEKTSVHYEKPKTPFTASHTHPNWDSPLSGSDLANFLKNPNYIRTTASSKKRIYSAVRTSKTIMPRESYNEIKTAHEEMIKKINQKATAAYKGKTGWSPTGAEKTKIFRGSIEETNEIFAKKYNFDLVSFTRK